MVVTIQQILHSWKDSENFSKNCVARLYCVVVMIRHAYVDVYVLCFCIVGHGGDYTTDFTFLERF